MIRSPAQGCRASRLPTRKSPVELENAKRAIVGGFALSLEQPTALLQNIVTQKLYDLPANHWVTYPQKVEAITAEDVQRVAQKYIDLNHLQNRRCRRRCQDASHIGEVRDRRRVRR